MDDTTRYAVVLHQIVEDEDKLKIYTRSGMGLLESLQFIGNVLKTPDFEGSVSISSNWENLPKPRIKEDA